MNTITKETILAISYEDNNINGNNYTNFILDLNKCKGINNLEDHFLNGKIPDNFIPMSIIPYGIKNELYFSKLKFVGNSKITGYPIFTLTI